MEGKLYVNILVGKKNQPKILIKKKRKMGRDVFRTTRFYYEYTLSTLRENTSSQKDKVARHSRATSYSERHHEQRCPSEAYIN